MANDSIKIVIVKNDFLKIADRNHRAAAVLIEQTAYDIETRVKISMAQSKSGRTYKRGEKEHVASAPGEAPAVDTGSLINSVVTRALGFFDWVVAITAEYAAALEFGSGNMAARPYLRPAVAGARPRFLAWLRRLYT